MALFNCPECGKQISDKAVSCPNCGAPVSVKKGVEPTPNKSSANNPNRSGFMKVCRYCKASMPKEDTICPHCKKKQTISDWWIVPIILIVFAFLFVSMLSTSLINTKSKRKQTDTKTAEIIEKVENQSSIAEVEKNEKEIIDYTNSKTLYYMDLYENYEDYLGNYVTISAPLSYVDGNIVNIKDDIEGSTGMIHITLLNPNEELAEGDFVTVTGFIENKVLGYLYMNNASILETGDEPYKIYSQQKDEYSILSAQRAAEEMENLIVERQNFIDSAIEVSYDELRRYPDTYRGQALKLNLYIDTAKPDGWVFQGDIIATISGTSDKIGVYDDRQVREPRFVEGDTVTVYATGNGLATLTIKQGTGLTAKTVDKYEVPSIKVIYTDLDKID